RCRLAASMNRSLVGGPDGGEQAAWSNAQPPKRRIRMNGSSTLLSCIIDAVSRSITSLLEFGGGLRTIFRYRRARRFRSQNNTSRPCLPYRSAGTSLRSRLVPEMALLPASECQPGEVRDRGAALPDRARSRR